MLVTETRAEIQLQTILDKTAQRLVEAQEKVLKTLPELSSLTFISKWGCDGSSGHNAYKQKLVNAEDTDECLFVFSTMSFGRILAIHRRCIVAQLNSFLPEKHTN